MPRSPKKVLDADTQAGTSDTNGQFKRSSPRKHMPAVIKLKVPEIQKESMPPKPLKLTLKFNRPAEVEKETTKITPKLTLSLRKPSISESKDDIIDVVDDEKLPKKRGRKPGLKKASSFESTTQEKPKAKRPAESAPPSLAASKSSIASSSATSLPAAPTIKPISSAYSEEDRIQRQVIGEILQGRITKIQAHRPLWNQPMSKNDLVDALYPFYEQLSVAEPTHFQIYRQASIAADPNEIAERQKSEADALFDRFNALTLREKSVPNIFILHLLKSFSAQQ